MTRLFSSLIVALALSFCGSASADQNAAIRFFQNKPVDALTYGLDKLNASLQIVKNETFAEWAGNKTAIYSSQFTVKAIFDPIYELIIIVASCSGCSFSHYDERICNYIVTLIRQELTGTSDADVYKESFFPRELSADTKFGDSFLPSQRTDKDEGFIFDLAKQTQIEIIIEEGETLKERKENNMKCNAPLLGAGYSIQR